MVLEGAEVLGGARGCWVVLRLFFFGWCFNYFFLGAVFDYFFGGWCFDFFFLGGCFDFFFFEIFRFFFDIINFDKNFIENIYFLLFENFMYRFKNIVILFKFNCFGKFILRSLILLKTLVTVSI